jgi:hypothetical protein
MLTALVLTDALRLLDVVDVANKPAGLDFCSKVTCAFAAMGRKTKDAQESTHKLGKLLTKLIFAN